MSGLRRPRLPSSMVKSSGQIGMHKSSAAALMRSRARNN